MTIEVVNKEKVYALIEDVLDGKIASFECKGFAPADLEDYFQDKELSADIGDLKQNGWQFDWWLEIRNEDHEVEYMASGCGYTGEFKFEVN